MEHMGMDMDMSHEEDDKVDVQTSSGTSWVPATTPDYSWMHHLEGGSHLMIHGGIFPRYTYQSGVMGDKKFDSPSWAMAMYETTLGEIDYIQLRAMLSADPIIEGNRGYPLLFQTGEGLSNRQHPHDLFDELAVTYTHEFSDAISVKLYGGLPGEPALGPPAFMHRSSATGNPDAPLSHHWQDATHITFGVATVGIQYYNLMLESSIFNGREPDTNRYGIDKPRFDSYSGRISYNPTNELALQISYGQLTNVEGDSSDLHRLTASAIYTKRINANGWWTGTIVFGQNKQATLPASSSILLESQWMQSDNTIYGRAECVQKERSELGIAGIGTADISAITAGYSRKLATISMLDLSIGMQATYNIIPPSLNPYYGNSPYGVELYISIHPSLSNMMHLHH
ncbi:MAG TPA: hypothetical protein VFO76_08080 [Candidatus Kapabacteria bacterium]|nr:hypothetical protein [Candidatus Kapabacteria bacterium]